MKRLLKTLLDHRAVVFGAVLIFALGCLATVPGLPVEAVPDISPRQVLVSVVAPGLAAEDVEHLVTFPVEAAMAGIPELVNLRSVSRAGVSVTYVQFTDASSIDLDRARVLERLAQAQAQISVPGVSVTIGPLATGLGEIMQLQIRGGGQSLTDLNRLMTWVVAPQLKLVPGVVDVNVNGGGEQTFQLAVDPRRMMGMGVSIGEIYRAVEENNADAGGGWIEHHAEQQVVTGRGLVTSLEGFAAIPVRGTAAGTVITLRDLGTISYGARTRLGAVTRDGQGEIVIGVVMMRAGASSDATLAAIRRALPSIRRSLPPGVTLDPYYVRSTLTDVAIRTVKENLALGAALVLLTLFVVIGDWRAALVITSVVPFALLSALAGMRLFGISANLMSLGAIDFGMIVDSALVVVEHLISRRARAAKAGAVTDPSALIVTSTSEIVRPVTFAIMVIVIVYLPILSLQDIEGKMFRPMAQTVVMALLASLAYGLLVVPVLAGAVLRGPASHGETRLLAALRRPYLRALDATRAHSARIFMMTGAIFLVSLWLGARLGAEFLPTLEEGALTVTTTRLPSISLPQTLREVTEQERILRRFPEVAAVVTNTGTSAIPTDPMGVNESDSFVLLKPRATWTTAATQQGLVAAMSRALSDALPEMRQTWSQPVQMRMEDLLAGVRTEIAVSIYGDDLSTLTRLGDQVATVIRGVRGAADVAPQSEGEVDSLHIDVNRVLAARHGVTQRDILDTVEAIGGHVGRSVMMNDALISTQIRFAPAAVADAGRIAALRVRRDDARGYVALGEVAQVRVDASPPRISREALRRRVIVQANVRGRDLSSFVAEAQRAVARDVSLPLGYQIGWAGQFRNLQSAMSRLEIVVPIALALIFALLVLALGSPLAAAVVFVNVPFAATGGIVALTVCGMPFSIPAGIGFIALFGVAILNGVVLVSTIRARQSQGEDTETAAFAAAAARFRPVMATALVASLGFLPMALSRSGGAEVERPLATVVIGGLVSSTLLTLLVLPAAYARIFGWRATWQARSR